LRQRFGVCLNPQDPFFDQWLDKALALSESEQAGLERLKRNYEYLSEVEPSLEEVVKLVVMSPLLDLAVFLPTTVFRHEGDWSFDLSSRSASN